MRICIIIILFISCRQNAPHVAVNNFIAADTVLIVTMSFSETNLLKDITEKISSFYNCKIKIRNASLPSFAFVPERNRYKADSILKYLNGFNNGNYRFISILTSKDISTTKGKISDYGIFGLGSFQINTCVSSTFRLKKNVSTNTLLERLQKVILHEIGHNYGLRHCTTNEACFMKDAEGKISTVDQEPMDLCSSCRSRLN